MQMTIKYVVLNGSRIKMVWDGVTWTNAQVTPLR